MNYLAHLFLAGKNTEIILGNVLEDYITGNIEHSRNNYLSEGVKVGVFMHRCIDTFTDTDLGVKKCKELFYPNFGKYSPIIIDVLFDHFLWKNWNTYTSESFDNFRPRIYFSLKQNLDIQPESMIKMVDSMIEYDWLKNYSERWGLERAFLGLNNKIKNPKYDLRNSLEIYEKNYDFLNNHFQIFFPKLKLECDKIIADYGK